MEKNLEVTHGQDPCGAQGIMSAGSWELSPGSEGRKNCSLCSLSSFSSALKNAGTGEPVQPQTHPILQQGASSEPPAEEELLTFRKGGEFAVFHTRAVPRVDTGEICVLHKTEPVQHSPGKVCSCLREGRNSGQLRMIFAFQIFRKPLESVCTDI